MDNQETHFILTPRYSRNTAKVGVKHQSINHSILYYYLIFDDTKIILMSLQIYI